MNYRITDSARLRAAHSPDAVRRSLQTKLCERRHRILGRCPHGERPPTTQAIIECSSHDRLQPVNLCARHIRPVAIIRFAGALDRPKSSTAVRSRMVGRALSSRRGRAWQNESGVITRFAEACGVLVLAMSYIVATLKRLLGSPSASANALHPCGDSTFRFREISRSCLPGVQENSAR